MSWAQRAASEFNIQSIDLERMQSLESVGGMDLVISVIDLYLDVGPKTLAKLQAAVTAKVAADIGDEAHSLKSMSSNIGAANLAKLCESLEQDSQKLLAEIEAEFARVKRDLESLKRLVQGT